MKKEKKLHDYKNLMFKDILSNLWYVLHPCLHFKLVASSVKPGGFPQTQQRWWRGPGSAWGCRALRCIGLCCSTSWSSCRRSCLCQSPHLQSCCSSLLLGNPSSWCPQIQLLSQLHCSTVRRLHMFFQTSHTDFQSQWCIGSIQERWLISDLEKKGEEKRKQFSLLQGINGSSNICIVHSSLK